ncbi:MAG: archaeosortase/exosortase family protein [Cyclobacteriaceae bacterium]
MNPIVKKFLIRAGIIYLGWLLLYHAVIVPDGRLNKFLTDQVSAGTVVGLELLGYDTDFKIVNGNNMVYIDGQAVVLVADACNGLELFALYTGFLLAFPGRLKYKAIFVPVGILLIFLINVMREVALSLNYKFFQETFELNHKYTYVFIVYVFVFIIWRYWLKNYSALVKA